MASSSGSSDIWWFVGILAIFFILWVSSGGPQRAEEAGLGEIKVGQKYNNQTYEQSPGGTTPTPGSRPKSSGNGQIIY